MNTCTIKYDKGKINNKNIIGRTNNKAECLCQKNAIALRGSRKIRIQIRTINKML